MKYQLIPGSLSDLGRMEETVLRNRGVQDWRGYLDIPPSAVSPYTALDGIDEAIDLILSHAGSDDHIHIVVDSDADGYTSAAEIYLYLQRMGVPADRITYSLHPGKEHGLTADVSVPEGTALVIIPDAGSSDVEQITRLTADGMHVLIMDHHEIDAGTEEKMREIHGCVLVNNQISKDYPNKELSGAGVVFQVLRALDHVQGVSWADDYADLMATGNIADVMDMRSKETKYLCDLGLTRIRNRGLLGLVSAVQEKIGNPVCVVDVQFYVAPLINAGIRFGSQEDKEVLFRALIQDDAGEYWYMPPGGRRRRREDIYARAARLCQQAKAAQNLAVETGMEALRPEVDAQVQSGHTVLMLDATGMIQSSLTGFIAGAIAGEVHHPTVVLKRQQDDHMGGSLRNFSGSPLDDLKQALEDTGCFSFLAGHANAAGVGIAADKVENAQSILDERLSEMDFTPDTKVDFDIDYTDLTPGTCKRAHDMRRLWGAYVDEAVFAVHDIPVKAFGFTTLGAEGKHWKYRDMESGLTLVRFNAPADDPVLLAMTDWDHMQPEITIGTALVRLGINAWRNEITPQLKIVDYEI